MDKQALESQEWGCNETLNYFKLKNVKSGFTSDIAEIIIEKLIQMSKLEKVKLMGIKLEDKPNNAKTETSNSRAQKAGGVLRKSLGGLFKEKKQNQNETLNES